MWEKRDLSLYQVLPFFFKNPYRPAGPQLERVACAFLALERRAPLLREWAAFVEVLLREDRRPTRAWVYYKVSFESG